MRGKAGPLRSPIQSPTTRDLPRLLHTHQPLHLPPHTQPLDCVAGPTGPASFQTGSLR